MGGRDERITQLSSLFLLFNHQFTPAQESDARAALGVENIVGLPPDLRELWSNIPPGEPDIKSYLEPVKKWLRSQSQKGDCVLIQGDFGACYLLVNFAFERNLVPVYSTTQRTVVEEGQPSGAVKLTHHFQHQIFRRYGR